MLKKSAGKRSRAARMQLSVVRDASGWAVRSNGGACKTQAPTYSTQKQAQEAARTMVRGSGGGEVIVHDRLGRIKGVDTYVLGDAAAKSISAVEGIHLTQAMARDFREMDRLKLTAEERREWLKSRYGKGSS